jgi:hypothetical protein
MDIWLTFNQHKKIWPDDQLSHVLPPHRELQGTNNTKKLSCPDLSGGFCGYAYIAQVIIRPYYINYHWTWTIGSDSINNIYQLSLDMDIWLRFNQQNISTIIGHGHLAQIQSTKYINYHWTWTFGSDSINKIYQLSLDMEIWLTAYSGDSGRAGPEALERSGVPHRAGGGEGEKEVRG